MRIWAETYTDWSGIEMSRRLHFDDRAIDVVETIDQWHGHDYRYFEVKSSAGDLYILRFDETQSEWDLTMFQSARSHAAPTDFFTNNRPTSALRM
jgi:hypothetical protein